MTLPIIRIPIRLILEIEIPMYVLGLAELIESPDAKFARVA
jgi:hypothetical protein